MNGRVMTASVWLLVAAVATAGEVEVGKAALPFDAAAVQPETAGDRFKGAKRLKLADFKGEKHVVLFFYPKALTKGCTVESCGFRDSVDDFAKLDTVVIGISTDTLELQQQFAEKERLNFPLLADADKIVTKAYGALNPAGTVANRYTFVIDKNGVVRKVYSEVKVASHPRDVLQFIRAELKDKK